MSDDISDKKSSIWLTSLITHPAIGLIGIAIAVISLGFYFVDRKEIKPLYSVSTPQLLAEITDDTPKLQLLWDGQVVSNVYLVRVALWNGGREYLDKERLSVTDPLRLDYPGDVTILSHSFSSMSRNSLAMRTEAGGDAWPKSLVVKIEGDEALERNDGGILTILYSGYTEGGFSLEGRIKGVTEGFSETDWLVHPESGNIYGFHIGTAIMFFVSVLATAMVLKVLIFIFRQPHSLRSWGPWAMGLPVFIFLCGSSVYFFYEIYIRLSRTAFRPDWLW